MANPDPDPTPDDIAAQEQDELWREQRLRPWHQRPWLRALLVTKVDMAGWSYPPRA